MKGIWCASLDKYGYTTAADVVLNHIIKNGGKAPISSVIEELRFHGFRVRGNTVEIADALRDRGFSIEYVYKKGDKVVVRTNVSV